MGFIEDDLVQDLAVVGAVESGCDITVSVYGSRRNVCGTVRFTFPDPEQRLAMLARLQRWEATGQPVALLTHGDTVSLFNEQALLKRALESA